MVDTRKTIKELAERKALFVWNHSGGKDSQAGLIKLLEQVPASQIIVIHASLGDVEWPGALELAKKQAEDAGLPFIVAKAGKTFFDMVERRYSTRPEVPSFPSASHRQCTSDLKRAPIEREIRAYVKKTGQKLIVNCMGIRAEESTSRSKLNPFKLNERNSVAGREWYDLLPIHDMKLVGEGGVWDTIAKAGQKPHWAYAAGNERLSCMFCIMGSKRDLANAADHNPALYAKYVEAEKRTGYTMHQSRTPLDQLVAEGRAIRILKKAA